MLQSCYSNCTKHVHVRCFEKFEEKKCNINVAIRLPLAVDVFEAVNVKIMRVMVAKK